MSRYTSATDEDRRVMLERIGAASIDELFADLPEGVRLGRALELPAGKPEQEVYARLRDLAARNVSTEDELSFLGAGMYDHYVPALIDSILQRSEFLTPYTPYQPEISQGGLQVMFEYQTAISELTGLPASNASVYEGPERGGRRRLAREAAHQARPLPRLAGAAPALARVAGHHQRRLGDHDRRAAAGRRRHRSRSAARGDRRRRGRGVPGQPNFLGAVEDLEALGPSRARPARC